MEKEAAAIVYTLERGDETVSSAHRLELVRLSTGRDMVMISAHSSLQTLFSAPCSAQELSQLVLVRTVPVFRDSGFLASQPSLSPRAHSAKTYTRALHAHRHHPAQGSLTSPVRFPVETATADILLQ